MDKNRELDLVKRAQAGDRDSYGQLADLYAGAVLATAYSRIGNYAVSQDIAQDAFLLGLENLSKLRQPRRFGLWLRTIAKNLCRDWHRSEAYRKRLQKDTVALKERLGYTHSLEAGEELEQKEMRNLIDESLADLPARDRESLLLYYFEGKSIAEAARAFDISPAAMKKRLERARRRLRDQLSARVEAGLLDAAKGRGRVSGRVLAAIPLGASYAKIAPVTFILPAAPTLHLTGLLARTGGMIAGLNKTAAVAVALIAIGGTLLMTAGNRPAKHAASPPAKVEWSVTSQQEREDPTDAPQQKIAGRNQESASEEAKLAGLAAGALEQPEAPSISGAIRDTNGNPLAGAHVEARRRREPHDPQYLVPRVACETTTAVDGTYVLAPLPADEEMLLFVTHPDWANGGVHVEPLGEDEVRIDVDFRLARAESLSGSVIDDKGQPIHGAYVTVGLVTHKSLYKGDREKIVEGAIDVNAAAYGKFARATTDAHGRFTLADLPEDSYVKLLRADGEGYGPGYAWNKESVDKGARALMAGRASIWSGFETPVPSDDSVITLREGGSLSGRVVESGTGDPIKDALVLVSGSMLPPYDGAAGAWFSFSGRTDESGRFRVDDITPIEVNVQAKQGEAVSDIRPVQVRSGETADCGDLQLEIAGAIEGTVYDAQTSRPIPDLVIHYRRKGVYGDTPWTRTDAFGRYHAEGLHSGDWYIVTMAMGWRCSEYHHPDFAKGMGIPVTVEPGRTLYGVDVYLEEYEEPSGSVGGTVRDSAGKPVGGATVLVSGRPMRAVTDEHGEYIIERVQPGHHNLTALDPISLTYGGAQTDIEADEESVANITLQDKAARIRGTVLDANGQPVSARTSINVFYPGLTRCEPELDETGSYDCGPVPPGRYFIEVMPPRGYRSRPADGYRFQLSEGEEYADADFVLTRMTGTLQGTLVYPNGSPASGKSVLVMTRGTRPALTKTDGEGRFRIDDIDGDELHVQVGQAARSFSSKSDPEWLFLAGISAGETNLQLVLSPVGYLAGQVAFPDGELEPFRIVVEGELGFRFDSSVRSTDALFEIALQPDVYEVTIECPHGYSTFDSVVVESNMVTDLGEIQLTETVGTD